MEQLELPVVLEEKSQTLRAELSADIAADHVADMAFYPDAPGIYRDPEGVNAELSGVFQMLYYDQEGNLQGAAPRWSDTVSIPADPDSRVDMTLWASGMPQSMTNGSPRP